MVPVYVEFKKRNFDIFYLGLGKTNFRRKYKKSL
jgi:hypothetical protein